VTSLPIRRFEINANERFINEMIRLWWKYQWTVSTSEMGNYLAKLIRLQSIVAYYPNKYSNIQIFQLKDLQLINELIINDEHIAGNHNVCDIYCIEFNILFEIFNALIELPKPIVSKEAAMAILTRSIENDASINIVS
jgi:hypothetical protein